MSRPRSSARSLALEASVRKSKLIEVFESLFGEIGTLGRKRAGKVREGFALRLVQPGRNGDA